MWFAKYPGTSWEVPDDDGMWLGSASTADHVRRAKNASHQRSPDHDYYSDVAEHLDGNLATISMARKLARRCFHVLRAVDPDVVYTTP